MKNSYLIPASIIVAGALIGFGVFLGSPSNTPASTQGATAHNSVDNNIGRAGFRHVDDNDFVRGNPEAPITIVEFADFQCPFCARLHPKMERLISEYPEVKWAYRHFPLSSIHSQAVDSAIAAECAGTIGGNDVFWNYADALFDNQRQLGNSLYTSLAEEMNIDANAFAACRGSDKTRDAVLKDRQEALENGGSGTPFSVAITPDGELISFSGSLPYEQLETLISRIKEQSNL